MSSPIVLQLGGLRLSRRVVVLGIFGFALILRAAYLFELWRSPLWDVLTLDTYLHDLLAREISGRDFFGHHPFFRAPLYPYLLGIEYMVFGPGLLVPRITNIVCGAASCALVFLIGERVHRPAVALAAGLVASVYWVFIYFEGELLLVAVFVFLVLLACHLLLESEGLHPGRLAAAGLVLGLATITRPNILVLYPFLIVWLALAPRGRALGGRVGSRNLPVRAAALFGPALAIIFGVTARNFIVGHDTVFIAYQAGINLFIGNNHQSTGRAAHAPFNTEQIPRSYLRRHRGNLWVNDPVWLTGYYLAEWKEGRELKPSEVQRHWMEQTVDSLTAHPMASMTLLLRKTYFFFNAHEIPNNKDLYFFADRYSRVLSALSALDFGLVVSLALLGMVVTVPQWRRSFLLYAFLVSYPVSVIGFFVNARYRVPTLPFFIIFASAFAFWLIEQIQARRFIRASAAVLVGLCLVLVSHSTWFGLVDPRQDSVLHFNLGRALAARQRYEAAVVELEESVRLYGGALKPYLLLSSVHRSMGRCDRAVEWAAKGLDLFPADPALHLEMGRAYLCDGQPDRAAELLEEHPYNGQARPLLGNLTQGRSPER